jgi:hypothetical protein
MCWTVSWARSFSQLLQHARKRKISSGVFVLCAPGAFGRGFFNKAVHQHTVQHRHGVSGARALLGASVATRTKNFFCCFFALCAQGTFGCGVFNKAVRQHTVPYAAPSLGGALILPATHDKNEIFLLHPSFGVSTRQFIGIVRNTVLWGAK